MKSSDSFPATRSRLRTPRRSLRWTWPSSASPSSSWRRPTRGPTTRRTTSQGSGRRGACPCWWGKIIFVSRDRVFRGDIISRDRSMMCHERRKPLPICTKEATDFWNKANLRNLMTWERTRTSDWLEISHSEPKAESRMKDRPCIFLSRNKVWEFRTFLYWPSGQNFGPSVRPLARPRPTFSLKNWNCPPSVGSQFYARKKFSAQFSPKKNPVINYLPWWNVGSRRRQLRVGLGIEISQRTRAHSVQNHEIHDLKSD